MSKKRIVHDSCEKHQFFKTGSNLGYILIYKLTFFELYSLDILEHQALVLSFSFVEYFLIIKNIFEICV